MKYMLLISSAFSSPRFFKLGVFSAGSALPKHCGVAETGRYDPWLRQDLPAPLEGISNTDSHGAFVSNFKILKEVCYETLFLSPLA